MRKIVLEWRTKKLPESSITVLTTLSHYLIISLRPPIASTFFDILDQFGDIDEEVHQPNLIDLHFTLPRLPTKTNMQSGKQLKL
jgi:hypothetical protein